MLRKAGQRVVALDRPPPPETETAGPEAGHPDAAVRDLDGRLHPAAERLPLAVYLLRRRAAGRPVALPEGSTPGGEAARCVAACWAARRAVLRVAHPGLGHVPVFPVDVLDALYSPVGDAPGPRKRREPQ